MTQNTTDIPTAKEAESAKGISPFPRDTLVIEATFPEPVSSGDTSVEKIQRYLKELSDTLNIQPIRIPETHLSPKYGLSGWVPLEDQSAIHLYAWDEEEKETYPFVSVDISTPASLPNIPSVVDHTRSFFGAPSETTVHKTMQNPGAETWRELAPHILRQRLSIAGILSESISEAQIRDYMQSLCKVLFMDKLSDPIIHNLTAWMHWETSGTIAHWDTSRFAVDIYTCKHFTPEKAIEFTRNHLKITDIVFQDF